ncbi:MAG TPA: hypothetical protein VMK13_11635 [Streptosporangiaceae bacterium]|nr:hypothetical protein [Streptosporangiaceae bacterium]
MPEAVGSPSQAQPRRITLNSDGRRHPVLNSLTVFTFVGGLIAFATGLIVADRAVATILGAVAFVVGLYAQMISATREQRILIMTGVVGAFVGMVLGIAHGGY